MSVTERIKEETKQAFKGVEIDAIRVVTEVVGLLGWDEPNETQAKRDVLRYARDNNLSLEDAERLLDERYPTKS